MPHLLVQVIDLVSRYLHIVSAAMLVGGTLFYEWIMPAAIDELKREHQLDVFGRARWFFRTIVWVSGGMLVVSGVFNTREHWNDYERAEQAQVLRLSADERAVPAVQPPGWWWTAHVSTACVAILLAVYLTFSSRPPEHTVGWMRINMVVLLIVVFLATTTRHMRQLTEAAMSGELRVPFVTRR
jgi:hypothetical protein